MNLILVIVLLILGAILLLGGLASDDRMGIFPKKGAIVLGALSLGMAMLFR